MSSTTEIIEDGVTGITVEWAGYEGHVFRPINGRVKFFRDQMKQKWAKFLVPHMDGAGGRSDKNTILVVPADRIVAVHYDKPLDYSL